MQKTTGFSDSMRVMFCGVVLFCAVLCGRASGADTNGPVIFRYKGQSYTAADLTLVSYADYQRHLEEARRIFDPAKHHPTGAGYYPPGASSWKTEHPDDLDGFYRHQLSGLIQLFVAHEVYLKIKETYGTEKIQKYIDMIALEAYIQKMSQIMQADRNPASLDAHYNEDEKTFRARCEKNHWTGLVDQYAKEHAYFVQNYPYRRLNALCFPECKDGLATPQVRWDAERMLLQYYVQAELEHSKGTKQKYMDLHDRFFGTSAAFIIRNQDVASLSNTVEIVSKLGDDSGDVPLGALTFANMKWDWNDSPVRVELHKIAGCELVAKYHLENHAIEVFVPIDIGVNTEHTNCHDYVYIFQKKATSRSSDNDTFPPSFLFDLAEEGILRPVFEEVLKALELSEGYSLQPSSRQVVQTRSTGFYKAWLNEELPKVVLADNDKRFEAKIKKAEKNKNLRAVSLSGVTNAGASTNLIKP